VKPDFDSLADAVAFIIAALIFVVAVFVILPGAVVFAWNLFAPDLFGLPKATIANGIGIVLMSLLSRLKLG
jgi:hypothetical protein